MKKAPTEAVTRKCIIPECNREQFGRGLCKSCYQTARRAIDDDVVDEETLVKKGLMLPSDRPRTPFGRALAGLVK